MKTKTKFINISPLYLGIRSDGDTMQSRLLADFVPWSEGHEGYKLIKFQEDGVLKNETSFEYQRVNGRMIRTK